MSSLFHNLNSKQIEAVKHINGPLLIMAGAGSGKTRTLTNRIAYLIQEHAVSPWSIAAVTFTNKAANEMKKRIIHLLHPEWNDQQIMEYSSRYSYDIPMVGTFHSFCVKILRKDINLLDYENNFTIYDDSDQIALIRKTMRDLGIDEKKINSKAVAWAINGAKNDLISPEKYANLVVNYFTEKVFIVYKEYQKKLQKNQALDFDDLIMKTIELFNQDPKLLEKYQDRFQFLSVDEYQDTNYAQYILVKKLAEKYRNLCVIGDSDQSIYSWRGANMGNILSFEKDYPDAKLILLEQNYRSTSNILNSAHTVIVKNKKRKEKKLWTENPEGEAIKLWRCENERHEGQLIINEIKKRTSDEECPDYTKFVILYRTNAQSRVLEETFMKNGFPYKIVGGVKFYERKEIKDIIGYLRIAQNPHDDISLLRIINSPPRKIGPKTIEELQKKALQLQNSLFEVINKIDRFDEFSEEKKKSLQKFLQEWKDIAKSNSEFPAAGVIKSVLHYTGYKDFLLQDGSEEGEMRFQNIQELIGVANKYSNLEAKISLATFLEEVSLITDLDQIEEKDNAVTMMTAHAAKGLEFQYVFIVGLEEGIFPHSRSLFDLAELEEERRLMYVAMTRAMENLYLLYAKERDLYGERRSNAPSQFIDAISPELIEANFPDNKYRQNFDLKSLGKKPIPFETPDSFSGKFKDGDKVRHPAFGEGLVVSTVGGIITIAFKNKEYGIKKFAESIAPLKKIRD